MPNVFSSTDMGVACTGGPQIPSPVEGVSILSDWGFLLSFEERIEVR